MTRIRRNAIKDAMTTRPRRHVSKALKLFLTLMSSTSGDASLYFIEIRFCSRPDLVSPSKHTFPGIYETALWWLSLKGPAYKGNMF